MLRTLALSTFLLAAAILPAAAQGGAAAMPAVQEIRSEIRGIALDGPQPREQRMVYFWRPSHAPAGELPVLYTADGIYGIYVAIAGLRDAMREGRVPPFLVVGMAASREHRHYEYVHYRRHARFFENHERWFINTVMPYAERVAGASSNPSRRAVGGYSNGADFTLAMMERHPELFSAALVHSPAAKREIELDQRAAHIRWVMSAGSYEGRRSNEIVALVDSLIVEISQNPSPVRRCVGDWGHEVEAWRDISPGSASWLFSLPGAAEAQTATERETCHNTAP